MISVQPNHLLKGLTPEDHHFGDKSWIYEFYEFRRDTDIQTTADRLKE